MQPASPEDPADRPRASNAITSHPVVQGALAAVLILGPAAWRVSALVNPETGTAVPGAQLARPAAYLALAPMTTLLDQLSLLSTKQHAALLLSAFAVFVAWRVAANWRRVRRQQRGGAWRREGIAAAIFVVGTLAVYSLLVLPPRPMARLVVERPDVVVVDFHSHTSSSHDGRRGFTLAENRAWHQATGFDAAYVTDHVPLGTPAAVPPGNPVGAGGAVVLLPGTESVYRDQHLIGLGPRGVPGGADSRPANASPPDTASPPAGVPTLIQTIPENLHRVPSTLAAPESGLVAIEISDGAPRGIDQSARERRLILTLADSLDLAIVAGSNNHGWARTAIAWNLLRIPGWRGQPPAVLDSLIRSTLARSRRHAVHVAARRAPPGAATPLGRVATAPALVWTLLTTLSPGERASWLLWVWAVIALRHARRRRAARRAPMAVRPSGPNDRSAG